VENLEIILFDFNKSKIDKFIYNDLKLDRLKPVSSHFFDNIAKKDLDFCELKSIEQTLVPKGTGNIVLAELELGILLKNVVILLSFDEKYGDIVLNFPENELLIGDKTDMKLRLKKLVNYLVSLQQTYDIPKIFIGYEPATDEDSVLIEMNRDKANYDQEIEEVLAKTGH